MQTGYVAAMQQILIDRLRERGIDDESRLADVAESGYFFTNIGDGFTSKSEPGAKDSYYGNKAAGLFTLDEFAALLKGERIPIRPSITAEYRIRSWEHAKTILAEERHRRYAESMSFRGQWREHSLRRAVPNPRAVRSDGTERMIPPSWWRPSIGKNPTTWKYASGDSIFARGIIAEPVIFSDMPDWAAYAHEHHLYLTDHLEEFPDDKCREIYLRYNRHFIEGPFRSDLPLLEQHYGIDTIGLDVTFDLAVALFFASHRFFPLGNGRATFVPVERGSHVGVVYCFVFRSPSIRSTADQIHRLEVFSHIPPVRPIRQQCALPAYHIGEVSAAARDLDAVLSLEPDFDPTGLPTMRQLFPDSDEDLFYRTLLNARERFPEEWAGIVEYQY